MAGGSHLSLGEKEQEDECKVGRTEDFTENKDKGHHCSTVVTQVCYCVMQQCWTNNLSFLF
jgi:hypothetical protein